MPSGKSHQSAKHKNKYQAQFFRTEENKLRRMRRCNGRVDLPRRKR